METLLYCAILFAAFWLWSIDRRTLAVFAAAALTWTRADGVMLGGTLCLLALLDDEPFSRRIANAVRLGCLFLIGIAPWYLFAWAYFGTPLPNTFGAKQEFLQGVKFITEGVERWRTFFGSNPLSLLALFFLPVGVWQTWQLGGLRPLPVWSLLYALGYTALNTTNFWYYTPLVNVVIILVVIGAEVVVRYAIRKTGHRLLWVSGGLTVLVAAVAFNVARAAQLSPPPPRMATYQLAGEWIAEHVPADANLMVADLGIVGYYARRQAIDSFGLIVPDMLFKLPEYATLKYKPDYLLATQYFLWRFTSDEWFQSLYEPVAQFSNDGDEEFSPMTLYRRRYELVPPMTALEGTKLPLTFSIPLQAGDLLPTETHASLELAGQRIVEATQPFLYGRYPTPTAPRDETLIEQIMLPLTVAPGEYRWAITAPVQIEGTVEVLPLSSAEEYVPLAVEWDEFVSLDGIVVPNRETWSGGNLKLLLEWRALANPANDFTVFVHLLDEDGALVAQHDAMPVHNLHPTSTWQIGERVVDEHEIILPSDLPAGQYTLRVGWYDWRTQERDPLATGDEWFDLPVQISNRFPGGSGLP
jgi:hypothetical protein